MDWTGIWRNQYGSELDIVDEHEGQFSGTFRTALEDSPFYGRAFGVTGIVCGDCISFAFADEGASGNTIASFTGMLTGGVIETMWFVVSNTAGQPQPWPHAVATNHDTFTRG
jgi:hypothetical protein